MKNDDARMHQGAFEAREGEKKRREEGKTKVSRHECLVAVIAAPELNKKEKKRREKKARKKEIRRDRGEKKKPLKTSLRPLLVSSYSGR